MKLTISVLKILQLIIFLLMFKDGLLVSPSLDKTIIYFLIIILLQQGVIETLILYKNEKK